MEGRKKSADKAFYATPGRVTSAAVISDARKSLSGEERNLRPIKTSRPFTPRESGRTLFSGSTSRPTDGRPPSAFSLGSHHFDGGSDSRPASGTRLTPLDHKPPRDSLRPRPASSDKPSSPGKRQPIKALPLDQLQAISLRERRNSLPNSKSPDGSDRASQEGASCLDTQRRVHSGPKERTNQLLDPDPAPTPPTSRVRGRGELVDASKVRSGRISSHEGSTGIKSERSRSGDSIRSESGYASDRSSAGARLESGGGKLEDETPQEAYYWNTNVAPLITQLEPTSRDEEDVKRLCSGCDALYKILEEGNLLGETSKRRNTALKAVYRLLDFKDPLLLIKAARILLSLNVVGRNLINLSRLIFRIAKDEKNDQLFLQDNILELIVKMVERTSYLTDCETLIYLAGSLKFLSGSELLLGMLHQCHCLATLAKLLTSINQSKEKGQRLHEQTSNLLVQTTAALRNLANEGAGRSQFIQHRLLEELCQLISHYPGDGDLTLNASRIFSKLTSYSECCSALAGHPGCFDCFLRVLDKQRGKSEVVVRICFALGNLTARSDTCRLCLHQVPQALPRLLALLRTYLDRDIQESKQSAAKQPSSSTPGSVSKNQDVLVKLIRVLANLSINPDIGPDIANNQEFFNMLLQILDYKEVSECEELVLNTVATINNLTYYSSQPLANRELDLTELLVRVLMAGNMEAMTEVTRVFGNISRSEDVRRFIHSKKIDEMMITVLDSGNREVVYTACGVLINLMVDQQNRPTLKNEGGITKLVDVLHDFGRGDWQLAGMVCMILANYSEKITSSSSAVFGQKETADLIEIIEDFLDETAMLGGMENGSGLGDENREAARSAWETQFRPVAQQLLARIETHHTDLEPLNHPGDS